MKKQTRNLFIILIVLAIAVFSFRISSREAQGSDSLSAQKNRCNKYPNGKIWERTKSGSCYDYCIDTPGSTCQKGYPNCGYTKLVYTCGSGDSVDDGGSEDYCVDFDGYDYYDSSYAIKGSSKKTDKCDGDVLIEAICTGSDYNTLSTERYNCPGTCSNGKCVTKSTYFCVDYDDGKDYTHKSSLALYRNGALYKKYNDECINSNELKEFFEDEDSCKDGIVPYVKATCTYGCEDGECKSQPEENIKDCLCKYGKSTTDYTCLQRTETVCGSTGDYVYECVGKDNVVGLYYCASGQTCNPYEKSPTCQSRDYEEDQEQIEEPCDTEWECSNWGVCQEDGFEYKSCIDRNNCNQDEPTFKRECDYVAPSDPDLCLSGDLKMTECEDGLVIVSEECINGEWSSTDVTCNNKEEVEDSIPRCKIYQSYKNGECKFDLNNAFLEFKYYVLGIIAGLIFLIIFFVKRRR